MTRQSMVWGMIEMVSLLVCGCISQPGSTIYDSPTRLFTLTPALVRISPTNIAVPSQVLDTPPRLPTSTTVKTSPTFIAEQSPVLSSTEEKQMTKFTVVYDNNEYDPALLTNWGFSCWVDSGETTILFDTGGDRATLIGNMAKLNLDPKAIDAVVLSHFHGDHTGGLSGLLDTGAKPTVYVPVAFSASFKAEVRERTDLVEVKEPIRIASNVYTTGQVGSGIVEQALVVETVEGLVIVTGCAHPGIVNMVRRAKEVTAGKVVLVLGGFHLGGASQDQVKGIITEFRRLGVQRVAPCHCTGDRARGMFADAYGVDCILTGVGSVISVGSSE